MDHPEGAGSQRADRVEFDRRMRVEFRGAQISSDGGLLVIRELDDALGLSGLASAARQTPCASGTSSTTQGEKRVISAQILAIFTPNGMPLGDFPLIPLGRCAASASRVERKLIWNNAIAGSLCCN